MFQYRFQAAQAFPGLTTVEVDGGQLPTALSHLRCKEYQPVEHPDIVVLPFGTLEVAEQFLILDFGLFLHVDLSVTFSEMNTIGQVVRIDKGDLFQDIQHFLNLTFALVILNKQLILLDSLGQ